MDKEAHEAAFLSGEPLPKALFVQRVKTKYDTVYAPPRRPDGTVDEEAIARLMLPAWAKSQKLGKRGEPKPIAGASDAQQVQRLQGQVEAPM